MTRAAARALARTLVMGAVLTQSLVATSAVAALHALAASHEHEATVRSDGGHVELVLAHAPHDHASDPAAPGLHAPSHPDDGHVLHLMGEDALRDSLRRDGAAAMSLAPRAVAAPVERAAALVQRGSLAYEPRVPLLVLRI